ncbi:MULTISPECIES: hypothetical protein [Actinomadura]|uniref:Integral membrane protein n=1 Tax=Actinomadura yumaensis TaxID=111807 RepID=A0ABW2CYN8_9ACTN|nr:hypothetical protein [Actinomadura sp. J1-007]MWK36397.1 hypothetical protein [Actinomadura sp. J1-007]
MSDLGRVLRLDARRTALLVAVPLLAGIGVVTVWLSLVPGVAYWDNSVVALVDSVRTLGPVAAGIAAWAAVRERRLDYLRDLTARSPATGVLLDLLLLSAAALAAYAAVTGVVVAATVVRHNAGDAHPLGIAAGALALVLHVVAGYLAGRAAPHRATPAAVVAATALWALLRGPGTSWWSLLPPAALGHVELFTGLRTGVQADQALWAAGLAAALILGYVMWLTRRWPLAVPLVLALALAVTATVRLQATDGRAVADDPVALACREWPLRTCVHPSLRSALPTLIAATTPLAARLNGTPGAITRIEQRPASVPASVASGVALVHLDDDLRPGYGTRAARELRDALTRPAACSAASAQRIRSREYKALVDAWLLDEGTPPIADAYAARRFKSWGERARRSWLRAHYARYRNCTLTARDFRPATAFSPRPVRPGIARGPRTGPFKAGPFGTGPLKTRARAVRPGAPRPGLPGAKPPALRDPARSSR